jgi:hypothetical protein
VRELETGWKGRSHNLQVWLLVVQPFISAGEGTVAVLVGYWCEV